MHARVHTSQEAYRCGFPATLERTHSTGVHICSRYRVGLTLQVECIHTRMNAGLRGTLVFSSPAAINFFLRPLLHIALACPSVDHPRAFPSPPPSLFSSECYSIVRRGCSCPFSLQLPRPRHPEVVAPPLRSHARRRRQPRYHGGGTAARFPSTGCAVFFSRMSSFFLSPCVL